MKNYICSPAVLGYLIVCFALTGKWPVPPNGEPSQGAASEWKYRTGGLEASFTKSGGVFYVVAVPGEDRLLAFVGDHGIWMSESGGESWTQICTTGPAHASHVLFDPQKSDTFWTAGIYGKSVFRSRDGGRTVELLEGSPCDSISVDFTDPDRRTLIRGFHEQVNDLSVSFTSGKTWRNIKEFIPAGARFYGTPLIVADNTFVVPAGGTSAGIYRSTDAGKSWRKVCSLTASLFHPTNAPLVTRNGTIYWHTDSDRLLRGSDAGLTWANVGENLKTWPVELPDGGIAAVQNNRIAISRDNGATWVQVGPPLPFKPTGLAYLAARKSFYVWAFGNDVLKLRSWTMK